MPTAEKDIANRALQAVGGKGTITALDETEASTSREARVCLQHFSDARDETLADADWAFARHRATLATPSEDAPDGWDYVYAYPDSCLQLRKVVDPNSEDAQKPQPFETSLNVAGVAQIISTDVLEAVAVYTRRITDPNIWSAWFRTALSYRLAMMIALPLAGQGATGILASVTQAYVYALSRGMGGVHHDRMEKPEPDASWIEARS